MSAIWLPGSRGVVDSRVWRLNEAAKEYDPRLMVGRNEENGAWAVFIERERPQEPFPVLHLGFDEAELPEPEALKRRLYEADAVRHGSRILEKMNADNERRKQPFRDAADDATWNAAEALEWGFRQLASDKHRSVVVLSDKEVNRRGRSRGAG